MNTTEQTPLDRLKHHVTGAIERGEKEAIVERSPMNAEYELAFKIAEIIKREPLIDLKVAIEQAKKTMKTTETTDPKTQQSARHTPLPWDTGARVTRVQVLPDGWRMPVCIADCHVKHSPETEAERVANAQFIVRACNAHYDLLSHLLSVPDKPESSGERRNSAPRNKRPMTKQEQIAAFAALVEQQQLARYEREYPGSPHAKQACEVTVKPGAKYTKVDVGTSGKYMVDEAGTIWGIKAYGVIHRGHCYGTLDTIHEWDWSGYVAHRLEQERQVSR